MRDIITLICSECGNKNYYTTKKKQPGQKKKIQLKKFCPTCGKHVLHKEGK